MECYLTPIEGVTGRRFTPLKGMHNLVTESSFVYNDGQKPYAFADRIHHNRDFSRKTVREAYETALESLISVESELLGLIGKMKEEDIPEEEKERNISLINQRLELTRTYKSKTQEFLNSSASS